MWIGLAFLHLLHDSPRMMSNIGEHHQESGVSHCSSHEARSAARKIKIRNRFASVCPLWSTQLISVAKSVTSFQTAARLAHNAMKRGVLRGLLTNFAACYLATVCKPTLRPDIMSFYNKFSFFSLRRSFRHFFRLLKTHNSITFQFTCRFAL